VSICDEPKYTCHETKEAAVGSDAVFTLRNSSERNISIVVGGTTIKTQERTRELVYSKHEGYQLTAPFWIVADGELVMCSSGVNNTLTGTFSESYDTRDTELMFLDLRNDIAVTKEVTNKQKITNAESTADTDFISIFTGYDSQMYNSYVFESVPIFEEITYNLYQAGVKTELGNQSVYRSYPILNLLMPTFPSSPWGIRINTEWALDVDWYRQDLRSGAGDGNDGDAYLFWPEWGQSCGKLDQDLDETNRALFNVLLHADESELPISGKYSATTLRSNTFFRGSVAVDTLGNTFYSIAIPTDAYATHPKYLHANELKIAGSAVAIPTEDVKDRVMDGEDQATGASGELVWTDTKESEYTSWFPIAPL